MGGPTTSKVAICPVSPALNSTTLPCRLLSSLIWYLAHMRLTYSALLCGLTRI